MTQQRFDVPALVLTLVVVGMAALVVRWLPEWQPAVADKTAEALVREALMLAPPPVPPAPAAQPAVITPPVLPPAAELETPAPLPEPEPIPVTEQAPLVQPPPKPVARPVEKPKPRPPVKTAKPSVAPAPEVETPAADATPAVVPSPAQQAVEAAQAAARQRAADAMAEYRGLLMALLAKHKDYPRLSRRLGEEGEARVAFEVAADGRVLSVALVQGSGHARLDEATLGIFDVLNRQLPPFLPSMPAQSLRFELPVRYALSAP